MRTKLIAILAGCGLLAAIAPALACDYQTNASNQQAATQQTAQSQTPPPAPAETHSN